MAYKAGKHTYELEKGWGKLPPGYEFHQVAGLAVDKNDQVYSFNRSSHQLMVFDRRGSFIKAWEERFTNPHGIHIGPDGNIYLADRDAHVVLKYRPDGKLLLTMGTRNRPSDTGYTREERVVKRAAEPFNLPAGIAVNRQGDIFVADGYGNARVHKYDSSGSLVLSWGSPGKNNPGDFNLPHGVALDNEGRVLVCDRENHRVQAFDQEGTYLFMWRGFQQPCDLAVGPDGTVYVAELKGRVSILDSEGGVLARWGGAGSQEPELFGAPHAIALDSRGDIYVGEVLEGKRIQKFARRR